MFSTPILFLVFNRLETTKQVFAKIREVKPMYLFIAADGPRKSKAGEEQKTKEVREYVLSNIDWPCEVRTLFRDENLGCGIAVSQAISWFFESVEMGIILEDDCLPDNSFFDFCETLLKTFKNQENIKLISGCNVITSKRAFSYYFLPFSIVWGWATWKRAWLEYNYTIEDTEEQMAEKISSVFKKKYEIDFWFDSIVSVKRGQLDTWDHQLTYTLIKNSGLCLVSSKNLIKNIGFGQDATHTLGNHEILSNLKINKLEAILHPKSFEIDQDTITQINRKVFLIGDDSKYLVTFKRLKVTIQRYAFKVKELCNKIF